MSDKSVCRTAPTTQGLLNRVFMYGSKDSKSRSTSKLHDQIKSYSNFNDVFCPWLIRVFLIWNQSTVDNIGVSRGRSVAVGVSAMWMVRCDRWKVTCDMWHVTCDLWHVTSAKKKKKNPKGAQKFGKVRKKAGFHSMGVIIRTRQKSRCLPYGGSKSTKKTYYFIPNISFLKKFRFDNI